MHALRSLTVAARIGQPLQISRKAAKIAKGFFCLSHFLSLRLGTSARAFLLSWRLGVSLSATFSAATGTNLFIRRFRRLRRLWVRSLTVAARIGQPLQISRKAAKIAKGFFCLSTFYLCASAPLRESFFFLLSADFADCADFRSAPSRSRLGSGNRYRSHAKPQRTQRVSSVYLTFYLCASAPWREPFRYLFGRHGNESASSAQSVDSYLFIRRFRRLRRF